MQKNFLLSYLRIRRDTKNANRDTNPTDAGMKINPRRKRQLDKLTEGVKSDLFMDRF